MGPIFKLIGGGEVGGKARGLSLAAVCLRGPGGTTGRPVLPGPELQGVTVPETWVIGTDVFEEFVERNQLRRFSPGACDLDEFGELSAAFAAASFPEGVRGELTGLLEEMTYPLAVRSSSRLEDSLDYSFAGKYYTTFISNRGSLPARLAQLEGAVKEVFASAYGPASVTYRRKRGLGEDSMAVMIQRLVGRQQGSLFYPEIAGVGYSRNYRRWTERVKAEDGVLRLVFGLGTRCTGRGYARLASLTDPELRPEGHHPRDVARYSQEIFDALDLETGQLGSWDINRRPDVRRRHPHFSWYSQVYLPGYEELRDSWPAGEDCPPGTRYVLSFPRLSQRFRPVLTRVASLFRLLEEAMGTPVDIEFAYDTETDDFALLQARALSSYEEFSPVDIPAVLPGQVLLRGDRMLTNGVLAGVQYLIYVDPFHYRQASDKSLVAREVGRLNQLLAGERYILVGPGRWGSSNPAQGVPVLYQDITHAGLLVEVGIQSESFIPELSYGTHFFADLESDHILYLPVFTHLPGNVFRREWFLSAGSPVARSLASQHPAVRVCTGPFTAYLDGRRSLGVVCCQDQESCPSAGDRVFWA